MASNKFRGLTFAITGTLSRRRDDIVQMICDAGGRFAPRVSNGVNYLVVGDTGRFGTTTKMCEAHKRGTRIIDEKKLWSIGNATVFVNSKPVARATNVHMRITNESPLRSAPIAPPEATVDLMAIRRELDEAASEIERTLGLLA